MKTKDRQTEPTELAVRYWDWRTGEERIKPTSDEKEMAELLRDLRADGLNPDVVSRPVVYPPPWVVDRKVQAKLDQLAADEVVALLAECEIDLEGAAANLSMLGEGLIHPHEVARRIRTDTAFEEACTLAYWLERAAELHVSCEKRKSGETMAADSNDERLDLQYDHSLKVIAGVAEHGTSEFGCHDCDTIVRTTTPAGS